MAERVLISSLSIFVAAILVAVHRSTVEAQELHVVGDSLGWIVPPGGSIAYSTWASLQTFNIGDILMFNFTTGQQDVAMVTKEAYDTCNSTSPSLLQATGPVNITLTSVGMHYFIGAMDRHCFLGQKLTVNVTGSSGPIPSPVAELPRSPMTYVVGDGLGWIVPPNPMFYPGWAIDKTFFVGDTLVFNFPNGTQDVAEVTEAAIWGSCNTTNPILLLATSPAEITLTTSGFHFFTSTYPQHCSLGQKLSISVAGTSSSTSPTSSITEPPNAFSPAPSPSSSAPATALTRVFCATFLPIITTFLL